MISKIHNCYGFLTETEKKIADVVLSCPNKITNMTVKKLALLSGTVPSAVVRFCQSIGANGFSDFKIKLSAELGGKATIGNMLPVDKKDTPSKVFEKVFASGINTLNDTLSMIDFSKIDSIIDLLERAGRVVFFGVGTSSVVAMDAQYRFAQLGIAASCCTDILFMNVTAANLTSEDVAICISHSGATKPTVDALRRAKKAGAITISISSFENSHLATEGDYSIIAFSDDKNYPVEAVSARIAHICIIDALTMSLAARNFDVLQKHIHSCF